LLVIGPPTANASILVQALSCSADLPLSVSSQLDYGLVPHTAAKRPTLAPSLGDRNRKPAEAKGESLRSQVVYLDDRDAHFAMLSLESTLRPDARAKTPERRPDGSTRRAWAENKMRSIVDALGLSHALQTAVGSPLVRGLSGGERKRASVAEALLARASVLLLDGPFNGLDSSTAVSLLEYLRAWASGGKRSVVITTPHCADALYAQFDRVLVLDSRGRQVYFGRATEAEAYFGQMGFQRRLDSGEGIAEFLVACNEGRHNDADLERRWMASKEREALAHELDDAYPAKYPYETCAEPLFAALRDEKSRFTSASSHYTVSFARQVVILTRRQYALIRSELPTYTTKTIVTLLLSVTVGTLFFRLPATTAHAFTRGSLLLLSIMFNAYLSLAELGKTIEGRDIVKRQGDYGFFSASALAVARVLGDLPLIGVQCLLFGTITYLLAGLQLSFARFGIYFAFVYATALNLSCLFRMVAAFSPRFEGAIRFCGVALNVLVMSAGYFIPTPSMPPWLKWVHYGIDPISYSYEVCRQVKPCRP
jgi:ATP-binding cassette subfamily G (WHITE) protein 2 (SNQ2)